MEWARIKKEIPRYMWRVLAKRWSNPTRLWHLIYKAIVFTDDLIANPMFVSSKSLVFIYKAEKFTEQPWIKNCTRKKNAYNTNRIFDRPWLLKWLKINNYKLNTVGLLLLIPLVCSRERSVILLCLVFFLIFFSALFSPFISSDLLVCHSIDTCVPFFFPN